jgi:hypothetical protein
LFSLHKKFGNLSKTLAAGIIFLLICTSFVSSSRNTIEKEYFNQNGLLSCNHKGIILSDSLYEIILSNPSNATDICEKSGDERVFLSGGAWSDDYIIYSCQYSTGILYAIDIETCEMWSIGGGGIGISALAYDQVTDKLYGSTSSNYLYYINPETGEQEQIGPFGSGVQYMIGLAFDSYGTLYGWDLGNDKLWTIDTESGQATEVGSLGISINYGYDGDFCKECDILYIPAYSTTGTLYECDKATGYCNPVGQLPGGIDVDALVIPLDYPPVNHPPYKPYNPRPRNGTSGVVGSPWFTCDTGDPDGDELIYDFYWGSTNPPPKVLSNVTEIQFDPYGEWLVFNTTIYWKVVVKDEHGAITEGDIWHITFAQNYPPFPAKNPSPPDGAEEVPVNAILNWTGWDPNGWDEFTYDVYFGLYDPPSFQVGNQSKTEFDPYGPDGDMQLYEDYYWKIVTWDKEGEKSIGPVWTFSTGKNYPPTNPIIVGPTSGRENVVYNYTFYIETEDRVCFEVDWGDGSPREKSKYYLLFNFIFEKYPLLGEFLCLI